MIRAFVVVLFGAVLVLLFGCDENEPLTTTVPAASASAASTSSPTPEKAAGVTYGTVKLCVVPKGGEGTPETVDVEASPVFIENDSVKSKMVVLKKEEGRGYCEFVHFDFSRWWGNQVVVKPAGKDLDEVGAYYLKDWKDNPSASDLTYGKFARLDNGTFALGVLVASANVPAVQVVVKE